MTVFAQDSLSSEVRADVVSHYMWRGTDKAGFSLQPQASVSWKGLSLQMYGSAGLNKEDIDELYQYFKESPNDDLEAAVQEWGAVYTEEEIRLVRIKFIAEMAN